MITSPPPVVVGLKVVELAAVLGATVADPFPATVGANVTNPGTVGAVVVTDTIVGATVPTPPRGVGADVEVPTVGACVAILGTNVAIPPDDGAAVTGVITIGAAVIGGEEVGGEGTSACPKTLRSITGSECRLLMASSVSSSEIPHNRRTKLATCL